MIASLDFRVIFFSPDSSQTVYKTHIVRNFLLLFQFWPNIQSGPIKIHVNIFRLTFYYKRSFAKPSSFTFKLNFCLLQFPSIHTAHAHTLFSFWSVGRSGHCRGRSLNLIFVCLLFFIDCYLLFSGETSMFFGAFMCNGWINFQRRREKVSSHRHMSINDAVLLDCRQIIYKSFSMCFRSLFSFSFPFRCASTPQQWASEQFSVMYVQNKHTQGTEIFCHY